MIRKFNEHFHKSRLFRFAMTTLFWLIGVAIVNPYSVNPWGVVLILFTWFLLETLMYGWSDIDI